MSCSRCCCCGFIAGCGPRGATAPPSVLASSWEGVDPSDEHTPPLFSSDFGFSVCFFGFAQSPAAAAWERGIAMALRRSEVGLAGSGGTLWDSDACATGWNIWFQQAAWRFTHLFASPTNAGLVATVGCALAHSLAPIDGPSAVRGRRPPV